MVSALGIKAPVRLGQELDSELQTRSKSDAVFWPEHGVQVELPRWALSGERSVMKSFDGHPMLVTEWRVQNPRATVVLFQGRGESAFRWEEPARVFNRAGIDVVTLDWPGQGLSGRFADGNAHHCDVRELVDHGRHFIETLAREGRLKGPVTVQGYSMGGCVAAALALDPPKAIDRIILHQPMTGLHFDNIKGTVPECSRPLFNFVNVHQFIGLVGATVCLLGLSSNDSTVWETERYLARYFDHGPKLLMKDRWRLGRERNAARTHPAMNVASPTWGFMRTSRQLMDRVRARADEIKLKTLIISGEKDRVVCNRSHEEIHREIEGSTHVVIPDGRHAVHHCEKPARRAYYDAVIPFIR
ncbi:MAG: alpha/beta hydrolase [Myxococcota bacterium]